MYRHRLRDIAARALRAEEAERKRIARELHDETAQNLAAILIRIRLLKKMDDVAERARALDEIREDITTTLEGIRHYARGLRPPALDELGLGAAIEAYARSLGEATGLVIRIHADRLELGLSPDSELALYRMVQEALSNIVKHARAEAARVRLERSGEGVIAIVEDDGRGFSVTDAMRADGGGLGLFGMRERAAYVGGTVEIDSEPGEGTRVRIQVPAAREKEDRIG